MIIALFLIITCFAKLYTDPIPSYVFGSNQTLPKAIIQYHIHNNKPDTFVAQHDTALIFHKKYDNKNRMVLPLKWYKNIWDFIDRATDQEMTDFVQASVKYSTTCFINTEYSNLSAQTQWWLHGHLNHPSSKIHNQSPSKNFSNKNFEISEGDASIYMNYCKSQVSCKYICFKPKKSLSIPDTLRELKKIIFRSSLDPYTLNVEKYGDEWRILYNSNIGMTKIFALLFVGITICMLYKYRSFVIQVVT